MDRKDAIAWVRSVCTDQLRASQAKTLSVLVGAMLSVVRVSLADVGRSMPGEALVKHRIKRAYRFIANERVEVSDAMRGVLGPLLKRWRKGFKNKPLLVSLDWTDVRGMQTLMAAAVIRGRSTPLIWASCQKHVWEGHKSRNSFEEALLLLLRTLIPKELGIEVVILADRGFGRTELGRFCQRYGFHYVIRIQPKVKLRLGSVSRRLDLYPVQKGICRRLNDVLYRDKDPVQQHVIIRWKPGLARDRDECWYLMTDLPQSARTLSDLYARRMGVEQLFRDAKNKRNGWSLRDTPITAPARLDRLILVMAIAYLLLTAVGLLAQTRYRPSAWSSNNRPDSLSAFRIGQLMLDQLDVTIATLIDALLHATPKWG